MNVEGTNIVLEGRRAFNSGKCIDECPYTDDRKKNWVYGYRIGRRMAEEEPTSTELE